MRFQLTVDGQPFEVVLSEKSAVVNGKTYAIHSSGPDYVRLEDGTVLPVTVVREGARFRVHSKGQWNVVERAKKHGAKSGPGGHGGSLKAPMNGVVVKVAVQPGQSVHAGDVMLVLEAMKMENEVTAPIAGEVSQVHVSAGQTVAAGAPLLEIKE